LEVPIRFKRLGLVGLESNNYQSSKKGKGKGGEWRRNKRKKDDDG
jgi:hypothetical protein